jgi:hypothetical protein
MSHGLNSTGYVESYLLEAYVKCFFHTHDIVPEFHNLIGLFEDAIDSSSKRFFVSDALNFPMEKHEMTWEYVEEVLKRNKMEFISMKGEHFNASQSILFPEWGVIEYE